MYQVFSFRSKSFGQYTYNASEEREANKMFDMLCSDPKVEIAIIYGPDGLINSYRKV